MFCTSVRFSSCIIIIFSGFTNVTFLPVLLLKYCYKKLFLVHSMPVSSYFAVERRTDDTLMLAACICLLIIHIVEPSYIGVSVLLHKSISKHKK